MAKVILSKQDLEYILFLVKEASDIQRQYGFSGHDKLEAKLEKALKPQKAKGGVN